MSGRRFASGTVQTGPQLDNIAAGFGGCERQTRHIASGDIIRTLGNEARRLVALASLAYRISILSYLRGK